MNLPSKEETSEIIRQPQFSLKPPSKYASNSQEQTDSTMNGFKAPNDELVSKPGRNFTTPASAVRLIFFAYTLFLNNLYIPY